MRKTVTPNPSIPTSASSATSNQPDTPPADLLEPPRPRQPHQQLINDLAAMYATIGLALTSVDVYDGLIIIQKSVDRATEVVNVAKHHPPMMKILKQITKSNDYIVALTGHGLMAYAIMAHHGRVPANPVLLQQTGYGDIPIAQRQSEELFEEAVPQEQQPMTPAEYERQYKEAVAQGIINRDIAEQDGQSIPSPLYYTVPDPRLGAWEVETPVGGDGQIRT